MIGLAARILPYALAFFSSLCIMVLELVASRLVARHVGASLTVWTSVIGIMLGGICLGNVLGGRLADRVEPRRAIGPLYALGAALVLGSLWMNSIVGQIPGLDALPWDLRTVLVVTLDFLVPGTVLGMIGPIVAKIAVEQAQQSGTALGDIYSLGAAGSILGTFLAGYVLIYQAPTSTIVTLVASALALLAAGLIEGAAARGLALATAAVLGLGAAGPIARSLPSTGSFLESFGANPVVLVGHALTLALAVVGALRLREARVPTEGKEPVPELAEPEAGDRVGLADLAALSFVASLAFMALEMVAGRLVTRHLGSSIYGWTSVIGVLLGGLSLGNYLGGKIANRIRREKQASWLFLAASVLTLGILLLESPPTKLKESITWLGVHTPLLHAAIDTEVLEGVHDWGARVLIVVTSVFLLPAIAMGTVSPVVAKLAVERMRRDKRTGTAIGQVYAWGMVGSILGTFLTGFVLINVLGTKGLILALGTTLALAAATLGGTWHAAWAGIPLGLCVIAFVPVDFLRNQGTAWGIREEPGNPATTLVSDRAYTDESNYYYIKVTNDPDLEGQKRTLVLDALIHGYFLLGHPEHIEYDYEFIYALVTRRFAEARARAGHLTSGREVPLKTLFLGGGSYTFPRYLQEIYPRTQADVAEIDPAVTEANHVALGLPRDTPIRTTWGDARRFVDRNQGRAQYDLIFGDAFNDFSVPWHLTTKEFNDKIARLLAPDGIYMINVIDKYLSDDQARARAKEKGQTEAEALAQAHQFGGFLGAWYNTARLTFDHIYVFGTNAVPGKGLRETYVVVASKAPLDLAELGRRPDDPRFIQEGEPFEPDPYGQVHLEALLDRSRGIVLTDDYAPVENLLAPVARTRGAEE